MHGSASPFLGTVTLIAAAALPTLAWSDAPRVAIVAAASNTVDPNNNTRFTDVRDKLEGTDQFASVDLFNATAFGPGSLTLAQVQQWDAVLVWSNDSFYDAVALGNVLADYVDAGGGVVVAVFANTSTNPMRYLQGRWLTGDYIAIPQNGGFTQGPGGLGQVFEPNHPLLNNVNSFLTRYGAPPGSAPFGGYRPTTTTLTPGSIRVANWTSGHTLVAIAPNRRVVELGFHPVSSDVNQYGYWDASTNGDWLMANALLWAAGFTQPCPGDANGNRQVDQDDIDIVLFNFGTPQPPGTNGDLDGDGDVDQDDIDVVLFNFGVAC